jgi:hypothetical protein
MRIANLTVDIEAKAGPSRLRDVAVGLRRQIGPRACPIRFSIVDASHSALRLEVTVARFVPGERYATDLGSAEIEDPFRKTYQATPFAVAQIVPTGIRCEFGGYAGACSGLRRHPSERGECVRHQRART